MFLLRTNKALLLLTSLFFLSCEKVDLSEETDPSAEAQQAVVPEGVGEGTQRLPYSVSQIRGNQYVGEECWVVGYAVGAAYKGYSDSNVEFVAPISHETSILVAETPDCKSQEKCIPVELPEKFRSTLGLVQNPSKHRCAIMLYGKVDKYFGQPGLRNLSAGYWLPDFSLDAYRPEDWK